MVERNLRKTARSAKVFHSAQPRQPAAERTAATADLPFFRQCGHPHQDQRAADGRTEHPEHQRQYAGAPARREQSNAEQDREKQPRTYGARTDREIQTQLRPPAPLHHEFKRYEHLFAVGILFRFQFHQNVFRPLRRYAREIQGEIRIKRKRFFFGRRADAPPVFCA